MFNRPALPDAAPADEPGVAVMFSGGMDSTVILADLLKSGRRVYPIAFDDGSLNFQLRRSVALELSTQSLGVYNRLIVAKLPELEVLRKSTSGFGFIPGMKLLMIITAMSYCQVLNVDTLYMGYNVDNQDGGFLDEGKAFMDRVSDLYYDVYGKERNTDQFFGKRIEVVNPYFNRSKAEMVSFGHFLGVDFSTTISCRQVQVGAGLVHCGSCAVCARRRLSFIASGVADPTIWLPGSPCYDNKFYEGHLVRTLEPTAAQKQTLREHLLSRVKTGYDDAS